MTLRTAVMSLLLSLMIPSAPSVTLGQMPGMPPMYEASKPQLPGEFPLYAGTPPGSKPAGDAEQWNTMGGYYLARNVTVPTLTPVLPDPAKATGAAVLVAPGGAYMALAMDTEGLLVARELAKHGIAAFVLKYRLDATPRDILGFNQAMGRRMAGVVNGPAGAPPIFQPLAVDDAAAAVRLLRAHASQWKIDPTRIGMVGFSAGAMPTLTLTLENRSGATPNFIGIIYGPMLNVTVPASAPPLFAALASDDPLFGQQGFGLIQSRHVAGRPAELHYYEHGDHGFGMRPLGTTSDFWMEEFLLWIKADKWLVAR